MIYIHITYKLLTGILATADLSLSVVVINSFAIFKYPSWPIAFSVTQEAAMIPAGKMPHFCHKYFVDLFFLKSCLVPLYCIYCDG